MRYVSPVSSGSTGTVLSDKRPERHTAVSPDSGRVRTARPDMTFCHTSGGGHQYRSVRVRPHGRTRELYAARAPPRIMRPRLRDVHATAGGERR
jgi:hypothetical protein